MKDLDSLEAIVVDRIYNSPGQKITFAEYMDLVLYHPQHGYYSSGKVEIGSAGDFFTSASLGADFGELLAEQFQQMWQVLGQPVPFMLVEVGAGQGILAADILNYLEQNYPNFLAALEYTIVERSPQLIDRQQELLQKYLDKNINICWKDWRKIGSNSLVGCCFSNELFDAFPVHQVSIAEGKLKEIYLTISNSKLSELIDDLSTEKLAEYFKLVKTDLPSDVYPNGYRTEVNLAALEWLEVLSRKLQKGYLLTIDYGYPAQKYYHPQRKRGTLQCYYQHRHHDNPYINIGQQDITAHVDFTALELYGELWGLDRVGFTKQGMFLMALGLGDRLSALSSGKANFQEILQRRDALHQLIDPTGLGGFGVLLQSKGLNDEEKQISLKGFNYGLNR
jgi:SAM-dependent MidA family methyltransferase